MEEQLMEKYDGPCDPKGHDYYIVKTKQFRVAADAVLQQVKEDLACSRECSLVITKLQEAIMWAGMELKRLGTDNPYPNSYKPENTIVDPTADRLKL